MSDDYAIRVENLGKRYTIGHAAVRERYTTLRDAVARQFSALLRSARDLASGRPLIAGDTHEEVWALRNLSFALRRGEVCGIIGRNGAGKSTLLKLLSRITEPTAGRAAIRGRVASLLEVGTGFHPELSGRENIFLNGAVLGMTRAEIRRKFDEIVEFAEVERYLDTPVKRYSSGMYVRLAFAVAAHLEPDILIVDEVLAVGDAAFQKKCLGKMSQVSSEEGRTVLFVSHNMSSIAELCSRAILLAGGELAADGPTREVIGLYLASGTTNADIDLVPLHHKGPGNHVRLTRLRLLDAQGRPTTTFVMNESLVARITLRCTRPMADAEIGLKITSQYGGAIHYLTSTWEGLRMDLVPGQHTFEVTMPRVWLYPGSYGVSLWVLSEPEWSDDHVPDITLFTVIKGDVTGFRTRMDRYAVSGAEVYAPSRWRVVGAGPEDS